MEAKAGASIPRLKSWVFPRQYHNLLWKPQTTSTLLSPSRPSDNYHQPGKTKKWFRYSGLRPVHYRTYSLLGTNPEMAAPHPLIPAFTYRIDQENQNPCYYRSSCQWAYHSLDRDYQSSLLERSNQLIIEHIHPYTAKVFQIHLLEVT